MMTAAKAARHAERSVTWLRTHQCAWCGQSMLNALRYGCSAEQCDPLKRDFGKPLAKQETAK